MGEIRKLIAENDIELPEDVLEAVSGGGCNENIGFATNDSDDCDVSFSFNTSFKKPNS